MQERTSSPGEASIPVGNGKGLEEERKAKSEGVKRRTIDRRSSVLRVILTYEIPNGNGFYLGSDRISHVAILLRIHGKSEYLRWGV